MMLSKVPLRAWFATLALGCFGLVAMGLLLQTQYRLAPCPFCIFQRLLYLVIGCVALIGFVWPVMLRQVLAGMIGLLAASGFGVAAYQTWMQAYPELAKECSYTDPNLIERLVDWLGMQAPSMFMATGFCTSKEWVFLGLSMANWSCLVFLGIVGYAVFLFKIRK